MNEELAVIAQCIDLIQKALKALDKLTEHCAQIPELTYRDVITYFTNEMPGDPRIVKGAVLKQMSPNSEGYYVYQVFLDRANVPVCNKRGVPYGKKWMTRSFDGELLTAFGGEDLLIVE